MLSGSESLAWVRSVRSTCATPAPARCACARCARRSAGAPRRWSSPAGCPTRNARPCGRPSRRVNSPGPVKYGYLSVGVVEDGDRAMRGRTVFCLHPHQTEYVVPATAACPVPERRATEPGGAGGDGRDGGERGLGRGRAARRPGQRGRRRHGRLLRGAAARRSSPGVRVELVDVDPDPRVGGRRPGRRLRAARAGRRRPRPRRAHERDRGRAPALPRPARDRGLRRRAELVRRRAR